MVWFLEKKEDDEKKAVYNYGKRPEALGGVVCFYKNPAQAERITPLEQESEKGFLFFIRSVWDILVEENYPEKRTVAIG